MSDEEELEPLAPAEPEPEPEPEAEAEAGIEVEEGRFEIDNEPDLFEVQEIVLEPKLELEDEKGEPILWDVLYGATGTRQVRPFDVEPRTRNLLRYAIEETGPKGKGISITKVTPVEQAQSQEQAWLEDQEFMAQASDEDSLSEGNDDEGEGEPPAGVMPLAIAPGGNRTEDERMARESQYIKYTREDGDLLPKIWLQQPGEPILWYNRFVLYRNQGIRRTFRETIRLDDERRGMVRTEPGDYNQAPHWRKHIDRWQWRDRAVAFDLWMQGERIRRGEPVRDEAAQRRRLAVDSALSDVATAIAKADISTMSQFELRKILPQLFGYFKTVMEIHQKEYKEFGKQLDDERRDRLEERKLQATQNNMTVNINAESFVREIEVTASDQASS